MTEAKARAVKGRNDVSRFVIHLTRDDRADFEDGATASDNFSAIIKSRRIRAIRPHCLHSDRIPERYADRCSVCCFTEAPLSEVHLITRPIPGRRIRLSPYGIVFTREFLVSKGAQPALYVNSYGGNLWLREAVDKIFDLGVKGNFKVGTLWRLVPFLNAMHEGYDFTWEREWRLRGDLSFKPEDVVCVILPEKNEEEWKSKFLDRGIPVIAPGWSSEQIVAELSRQARMSRSRWVTTKSPATKTGRRRGR